MFRGLLLYNVFTRQVVEGEFAQGLMLLSGYALPASRRCACGFMLHLEGYRHACLVTDDLDTVGVGLAG